MHNQPSLNHLWAALLLTECYRLGIRDVAIAPGSRSTPLALAIEPAGLNPHVHFDERGLGFFALGLAKASQRPVIIITTSGTAVANLYPAVCEAYLTGIKLLILSADRPPELIDNGANQAIIQPQIFGHYPVHAVNLPTPTQRIPASFLFSTLAQSIAKQQQQPGVVHINCMFADPLYLEETQDFSAYLQPIKAWLDSDRPWSPWDWGKPQLAQQPDWTSFAQQRGVIIAGSLLDPTEAQALVALAQQLNWPLLADIQSQLAQHPYALTHYDAVLKHQSELLKDATVVLQAGGRLISNILNAWLANHTWQDYWLIEAQPVRLDPAHRVRRRLVCAVQEFANTHRSAPQRPWFNRQQWPNLQPLYDRLVTPWSELGIAAFLLEHAQGTLFVGNSLPPRLLNQLAKPRADSKPPQIITNRGASGIDGLIATACGIAEAQQRPTTLLIGDISTLHDLNSLALLKQRTAPFVMIILNNDGGSIFRTLPMAKTAQQDKYYCLPHGLTFASAAQLFDIPYKAPTDAADFAAYYHQASQAGVHLIEIIVPSDAVSHDLAALQHAAMQHFSTLL